MAQPITQLSEEEAIFREIVREFAEDRIRPRVEEMERAAAQPRELLDELFELGLMGIEIPEEFGGAGGRLHVYSSARLREAGRPFAREGAMTKLVASRVAESVASRCVDVYGGIGVTKECPAEKYLREAKVAQIYEGTTFMQLDTLAKSLLRDGL